MTIPTNGLDFTYRSMQTWMKNSFPYRNPVIIQCCNVFYAVFRYGSWKFLRCIKTQGSSSYYLKYPGSESLMQYGTGDFLLVSGCAHRIGVILRMWCLRKV